MFRVSRPTLYVSNLTYGNRHSAHVRIRLEGLSNDAERDLLATATSLVKTVTEFI